MKGGKRQAGKPSRLNSLLKNPAGPRQAIFSEPVRQEIRPIRQYRSSFPSFHFEKSHPGLNRHGSSADC
jgi:hypothetical protein